LCWVEAFLLGEDKLEHGNFNHSKKIVVKKTASKPQRGFLLLSGQVPQFNSKKKDCFSQFKETV